MGAVILDGKVVAATIKAEVKKDVDILHDKLFKQELIDFVERGIPMCNLSPRLTVIIVGKDLASQIYVKNKERVCKEIGIYSEILCVNENVEEQTLLDIIEDCNNDEDVNGILVQMPLPKHIDSNKIIDAINPIKDVDGFHPINVGNMTIGKSAMIPCTPHGIMKMLEYYKIDPAGKKAVVMGRSNIVGKPMAVLLQAANATVTICHTKTVDVAKETRTADIIVVATGKPNSLTADMVKPGAVVIDVGINRVDGKLIGDVDFENVKEVAGYITPVPGGVGKITVAMLMYNLIETYKLRHEL